MENYKDMSLTDFGKALKLEAEGKHKEAEEALSKAYESRRKSRMKCPLENSCIKVQCDAEKLLQWQAKHSTEPAATTKFANKIAQWKCNR